MDEREWADLVDRAFGLLKDDDRDPLDVALWLADAAAASTCHYRQRVTTNENDRRRRVEPSGVTDEQRDALRRVIDDWYRGDGRLCRECLCRCRTCGALPKGWTEYVDVSLPAEGDDE